MELTWADSDEAGGGADEDMVAGEGGGGEASRGTHGDGRTGLARVKCESMQSAAAIEAVKGVTAHDG